ncbi:MAG: hypothetical protein U9N87_00470 [Planctomycetota bacterium]|nr:hypothetical protein [Planctomycetota bacterium]
MTWTKRLFGLLALLLGIAGILACFVGIAWTWHTRIRVDNMVAEISVQIDDVLARVDGRALQATEYIDNARKSTHNLNERVRQRIATRRKVSREEAADIDELERQLYARIQLARDLIGFMQSTMDLVEQLSRMIESASLFANQESREMADLIAAIREGKEEIRQTTLLVENVKTSLAEIRVSRNIDENAKRIRTLSSMIDKSLEKTRHHAEVFRQAIEKGRQNIAGLTTRIHRQTTIAAVLLTVIFVWIAVAQLCLAVHGWRALNSVGP